MDDETILSYGALKHYSKNNNVYAICMCGKGRLNCNQIDRKLSFSRICKEVNANEISFPYNDLTLTKEIVSSNLNDIFRQNKPDIVFTHSNIDMHFEHRLVFEQVLLQCRRNKMNTVKEFYTTTSQVSNQTFSQYGNFNPNYFIDMTQYVSQKKSALNRYNMELPNDDNDIRSIDCIINSNRQYGRLMNVGYCEAYQQLFKLA